METHSPADVFAPGRGGDGAPGRAPSAASVRRRDEAHASRPSLGGHVSQRRGAAAPGICRAHRLAGVLHDSRPGRCRRPDRDRAARARAGHHEAPVSDEGNLSRDLFARRQQRSGAHRGARTRVSMVRRVGNRAQEAVRSLRPREAGAERARLRRSASVLVVHGRRACAGAGHRRALRPRSRRRVSGHQPVAGLDPAGLEAGREGRHGRRRRRPIDLFVSRGDGPQHPRLSAAVHAAREGGHAGPQLPLDAGDPRRLQCRDRPRAGALHQEPLDRPPFIRHAAARRRAR